MRWHGIPVNRLDSRGISVFCEPPQMPINKGGWVERKSLIHSYRFVSNRIGFLSFSVSLPNSVSVEKRKLYVVYVYSCGLLRSIFTGSVNSVFMNFAAFQFCLLVNLNN